MSAATVYPTRRPPWRRLVDAARRAYLGVLIRSAERDVQMHEHWATVEPALAQRARQHAEQLRVQLALLETRT